MNTAALDSLLHWLLRTSLEASLLILVVLGVRVALGKRLSPAWRIGLWMVVGLKLLLPACIPAGFGLGHWWAANPQPIAMVESVAEVAPVTAPVSMATAAQSFNDNDNDRGEGSVFGISAFGWFSLWLAGVAIVLGAAVTRQRRFEQRLLRRPPARDPHLLGMVTRLARLAGVKQQVQVVLMPAGTTPAVVGCRHARLLLPEDWKTRFDDASLRHVLLHELLHIRQGDLLWNWAALGLQALHWFNPLVWIVVAEFQADRELRCDSGALALLAPNERLAYGHTLLRVQETFFAPPAIAGLAPCVRNHPTLRQRIAMITEPTRNRPWLQAIFAIVFGLMTCYAFTTVRAAEEEKELPVKDRSREATRAPDAPGERPKTAERDGEKPRTGERDGMRKKPVEGERDGEVKKTGPRDGEGDKKPGPRDGEVRKTASREGENGKKPGPRDGEIKKTGARDGEGTRTGPKDGEKQKTVERDGDRPAKTAEKSATGESIVLRVVKGGEAVRVGEEEIPMNGLRGYLQKFLPQHRGAKVTVTGDPDVSYKSLTGTVDAVRDNGHKHVGIAAP